MRTLEFEIPEDFADRLADIEDGDLGRAAQVGLKFVVAIAGADAYRRFLELAKAEGIGKAAMFDKMVTAYLTPAEELRPIDRATDDQKQTYNRLSATAKAQRRARNATIMQMVAEGVTRASIAKTVGISTIRVNQIVAEFKAANMGLDTSV